MIELNIALGISYVIIIMIISYLIMTSPVYYLINRGFKLKIPRYRLFQWIEFSLIHQRVYALTSRFVPVLVEGKTVQIKQIDSKKRKSLVEFDLGTFRRMKKNISTMPLEDVEKNITYLTEKEEEAKNELSQMNPSKKENKSWILYSKYSKLLKELLNERKHFLKFRGHLKNGAITAIENYVREGWLEKKGAKYTYIYLPKKSQARLFALMKYIWTENLVIHESFKSRNDYAECFFDFVNYFSDAEDKLDQFKKSKPTSKHLKVIKN